MRHGLLAAALFVCVLAANTARADDLEIIAPGSERFSIHGYGEMQLRGLSDNFDIDDWYLSQWAWILNLETEWNVAPDRWGPFDSVTAFARVQVRYECVWTGCAIANSWRHFGDRATRAPAANWADGLSERFEGPIDLAAVGIPVRSLQDGKLDLRDITAAQHTSRAVETGIPFEIVQNAFGPVLDDLFTYKRIDGLGSYGIRDTIAPPLGPWRPESRIQPNGALASKESHVVPLPMRPLSDSMYVPSARLRERLGDFDSFDQNFRQTELEWNHGASQDEWELKEAYFDFELFDSRLWIRAGKQAIVWGKTELFRNQDQFNPIDIGLASLPSLEDSRIPLWSIRGVWSFYDVGPLSDVRLEVAVNYDDFEPTDLGRCGEAYTVWLVCLKSAGLWGHGVTGLGIAGENRPPDPWSGSRGIEVGARIEFRWRSYSFAITDFYGYDDFAAAELFNEYARNVDPHTGKPLDTFGKRLEPETSLELSSGNRTLFELACEGSIGFGEQAALALTGGMGTIPDFTEQCQQTQPNVQDTFGFTGTIFGLEIGLDIAFSNVLGAVLAGQDGGNLLFEGLLNGADAALNAFLFGLPEHLVPLNRDPADGDPGGGFFGTGCASSSFSLFCDSFGLTTSGVTYYLTDEQEALLGCGPFYQSDCDVDGIDFFNAEASVLIQAFPGFEGRPVATRYQNGKLYILPGARGPGDPGYDPNVDGTPPPEFHSEMQAVSENFAKFTAAIGIAQGDTGCDIDHLETCATIRGFVAITGSRRPELRAGGNGRFGRADFLWHGGGELRLYYPKLNILGFSVDGIWDFAKLNWSAEFTWVDDRPFASTTSRTLLQESDVFNLTLSFDRPTFVNFLNANRTFFVNAQLFARYLPHHDSSYTTNGPLTLLGTLAITTGYFQDRLLPSLVLVHDLRSASGGVIAQATYRFNEAFSVTFGVLGFYGGPENDPVPLHPVVLPNTTTNFQTRTRFEGLSAIAERDEVFITLRHTF